MIQGRYDVVCPIVSAHELAAAWPKRTTRSSPTPATRPGSPASARRWSPRAVVQAPRSAPFAASGPAASCPGRAADCRPPSSEWNSRHSSRGRTRPSVPTWSSPRYSSTWWLSGSKNSIWQPARRRPCTMIFTPCLRRWSRKRNSSSSVAARGGSGPPGWRGAPAADQRERMMIGVAAEEHHAARGHALVVGVRHPETEHLGVEARRALEVLDVGARASGSRTAALRAAPSPSTSRRRPAFANLLPMR